MKRLNNYLLTHHPLIWNLRLLYIWPAILLLHLLFWLAGYASVSIPRSLSYYSLEPQGGVVSMATLFALLLLTLWLVFYFRNNAFKSFYPLRKGRLVAEFGLIFITVLGLTTFTASYAGGVYTHVRAATRGANLSAEVNTVNLAHHFLPFSRNSFSTYEDCSYHPSRSLPADSLKERGYDDDNIAQDRSMASSGTDTFSFLHYCNSNYAVRDVYSARTPHQNDVIAKRWLYGGRRDSVEYLLAQYLKLCKKYGAEYSFEPAKGAAEVFATPGFLVRETISSSPYTSADMAVSSNDVHQQPEVFIEESKVNYALSAIQSAREGWLSWPGVFFFLYFSLGIALLVFSFRATSVRVWFIALIGTAIWMAVFGVLAALVRGDSIGLSILFIVLSIFFFIISALLIHHRQSRRNAGVALLWSLWSIPVLIPLAAEVVKRLTQPRYYDKYLHRSPVHDWIEDNWHTINTASLVLVLGMVCIFYIPMFRRWQSAPEE